MVLRTALRLLGRLDAAQDAAQETFLRLFRHLGRFDESRELGPWLYRVVVNVCRDAARRTGSRRWLGLDAAEGRTATVGRPASNGIEETLFRDERFRLLQAALSTLPERERAALVLRDLEGLTSPVVARILGSSEGTVRSQVASARLKIKRFMEAQMEKRP
jgi:RNA polymerase sigma-70 factor (ECF subfamily)